MFRMTTSGSRRQRYEYPHYSPTPLSQSGRLQYSCIVFIKNFANNPRDQFVVKISRRRDRENYIVALRNSNPLGRD